MINLGKYLLVKSKICPKGSDVSQRALLKPYRNIEKTVEDLSAEYGQGSTICVLPEGSQTIPYVQETGAE